MFSARFLLSVFFSRLPSSPECAKRGSCSSCTLLNVKYSSSCTQLCSCLQHALSAIMLQRQLSLPASSLHRSLASYPIVILNSPTTESTAYQQAGPTSLHTNCSNHLPDMPAMLDRCVHTSGVLSCKQCRVVTSPQLQHQAAALALL